MAERAGNNGASLRGSALRTSPQLWLEPLAAAPGAALPAGQRLLLSAAERRWGQGLLIGCAPQPFGLDLERVDRPLRPGPLLRRYFPAAEARQLEGLAAQRLREAVLRSWAAGVRPGGCARAAGLATPDSRRLPPQRLTKNEINPDFCVNHRLPLAGLWAWLT